MKKIYVCSKLRGNIEQNQQNARLYCKVLAGEGDLPIAPHIYFTQFMNDNNEDQRKLALEFNTQLIDFCDEMYVFGDEISSGMQFEIDYAKERNKPVSYFSGVF